MTSNYSSLCQFIQLMNHFTDFINLSSDWVSVLFTAYSFKAQHFFPSNRPCTESYSGTLQYIYLCFLQQVTRSQDFSDGVLFPPKISFTVFFYSSFLLFLTTFLRLHNSKHSGYFLSICWVCPCLPSVQGNIPNQELRS